MFLMNNNLFLPVELLFLFLRLNSDIKKPPIFFSIITKNIEGMLWDKEYENHGHRGTVPLCCWKDTTQMNRPHCVQMNRPHCVLPTVS